MLPELYFRKPNPRVVRGNTEVKSIELGQDLPRFKS